MHKCVCVCALCHMYICICHMHDTHILMYASYLHTPPPHTHPHAPHANTWRKHPQGARYERGGSAQAPQVAQLYQHFGWTDKCPCRWNNTKKNQKKNIKKQGKLHGSWHSHARCVSCSMCVSQNTARFFQHFDSRDSCPCPLKRHQKKLTKKTHTETRKKKGKSSWFVIFSRAMGVMLKVGDAQCVSQLLSAL